MLDRKAVSGIMLTLIIAGMLGLAFNIQPAQASGTVYIRADGSIDPPTVSISSVDNITYTFTDDIYDSIVVERGNIIIDGDGHTLQGQGAYDSKGIALSGRSNVTIRNIEIRAFYFGIWFSNSTNNNIVRSNVTKNKYGFSLLESSHNNIAGNNITSNMSGISSYNSSCINIIRNNITVNERDGMTLAVSSDSNIIGNKITVNGDGIYSIFSSNNSISGNKIKNNGCGIFLGFASNNTMTKNNIIRNTWPGIYFKYSSKNKFCHNNFINNGLQIYNEYSVNTWDDGYPSGGNYWSDYTLRYPDAQELDASGIWDTSYVIDENNQDNYPLMNPWTPTPNVTATVDVDPDSLNLRSKGKWITAYIQPPEGYNAADINATTILLNGTISPVLDLTYGFVTNSSEYLVDHNNDGILERIVKFGRATVQSFICNQGIRYGIVALTITGKLLDGTSFEGTDIIFVNYAGDVNSDGTINILDVGLVNAHWFPGLPIGSLGYDSNYDLNMDGTINMLDAAIINVNWGENVP